MRSHRRALNRLEIKEDAYCLAQLLEDGHQIPTLYCRADILVDIHQGSHAPEEVLEKAHQEGGEVGEQFKFVYNEDGHIFKYVIADHGCIGAVSDKLSRIEQHIVKVAIVVAPLNQR